MHPSFATMNNESSISPLANVGLSQIVPALKVFLEAGVHRGELAALELSQVSEYAFLTVTAWLAAVGFVLLGGFAGTFMLAAMVWDRPDRTMILGLITLIYFLCAGLFVYVTVARAKKWRPFCEIRRQLHNDNQCLQAILGPGLEPQANGHARA